MKQPLAVVFQHRATREVETIDAWWRANRLAAPDLFLLELERALAVLAVAPTMGSSANSERAPGVRRVMLKKSRYLIYYRSRLDVLEVLAVWHAERGEGPSL